MSDSHRLFLSGESFFKVAQHARFSVSRQELRLRFDAPIYYLYSHALELTLKAFLRVQGVSMRRLKNKFGHSLLELWKECLARQLALEGELWERIDEIISLLEPYAMSFELRYVRTGLKTLPSLDNLHQAIDELMTFLRPICAPRQFK